jgi:hypothetical protein
MSSLSHICEKSKLNKIIHSFANEQKLKRKENFIIKKEKPKKDKTNQRNYKNA